LIDLKREEFILLPMMAYNGPNSLDAIATKFYGQIYAGQQTGDMISNDSYQVYDFSKESYVEDYQPEDCYKPLSRWKNMKMGDPLPSRYEPERVVAYDFDIEREGPMPEYILADLIRNGVLPLGKYLVSVSW
jgi:hypothetical protein